MYMLFSFNTYYPSGGWNDYRARFNTIEEARREGCERLKHGDDWFQIVDTETLVLVESY